MIEGGHAAVQADEDVVGTFPRVVPRQSLT